MRVGSLPERPVSSCRDIFSRRWQMHLNWAQAAYSKLYIPLQRQNQRAAEYKGNCEYRKETQKLPQAERSLRVRPQKVAGRRARASSKCSRLGSHTAERPADQLVFASGCCQKRWHSCVIDTLRSERAESWTRVTMIHIWLDRAVFSAYRLRVCLYAYLARRASSYIASARRTHS